MTATTVTAPRFPGAAAVAAFAWLALAAVLGATGFFLRLPFPGAQVIILGLVAATLVAGLGSARLRAWIDGLPLQALIGINASRLVGIVFLALGARGSLSPAFAGRAGWGDIAVAVSAIALVAAGWGSSITPARRAGLYVWNALGFLDLVVAVGTATIVTLQGTTPGVAPLLTFPLSLVPTFAVPLLLANHVFIFRRLGAHAA